MNAGFSFAANWPVSEISLQYTLLNIPIISTVKDKTSKYKILTIFLLALLLYLVDEDMHVPLGCLIIKTMDTKTMKLRIAVGIPSMRFIHL